MAEKEKNKDQITLPFPLTLNQDVFVSEDGKKIAYFNFKLDVAGEVFTLNIKSDDKKLFKHVIKNELGIEL